MKQRQNRRWIKGRVNSEGKLLCLVPTCNELRQKYKTSNRLRHYCSDHNYKDMQNFTSWAVLRDTILKRDNYRCVKCGKLYHNFELIADHIKPIALGGDESDINNIQTLCKECNKIKTSNDMKEIAKLRVIEKKQEGNQLLNNT